MIFSLLNSRVYDLDHFLLLLIVCLLDSLLRDLLLAFRVMLCDLWLIWRQGDRRQEMSGASIKTLEFDLLLYVFPFHGEWEAAHGMGVHLATALPVEVVQQVLSPLHHLALSERVRVKAAVKLALGLLRFFEIPTILNFVCDREYV